MTEEFTKSIEAFIGQYYISRVVQGLRDIDNRVLDEVSDKIAQRISEGRRIFSFGNGGSEAISESFILSLEQRITPSFQFDTYSNPKLGEATAVTGIDEVFHHRIMRSGRPGDLTLLVSASGDSENINKVSLYCRRQSVETISISGNGRVAKNGPTKSDYPIIIPLQDQQIIEDVTLGILYLIGEIAGNKVNGHKYDIAELKKSYIDDFSREARLLSARSIDLLAHDIIHAYKNGGQVRIDATDSGLLTIAAAHMQHNLKWDAFQNVEPRLSNRVSSGLPTYHFSGVGNDGGYIFNHAIEITDNHEQGDVEVIFERQIMSLEVRTLFLAAQRKGMKIYPIIFDQKSEYIASNLAQSILHITGRVVNAYLLSESNPVEFEHRLKQDLAMLRQRSLTMEKLRATYKPYGI